MLLWLCCSFLLFAASASNSHRRARIRISVLITPGKIVRVRSDFFPTRQIRLTSYCDTVLWSHSLRNLSENFVLSRPRAGIQAGYSQVSLRSHWFFYFPNRSNRRQARENATDHVTIAFVCFSLVEKGASFVNQSLNQTWNYSIENRSDFTCITIELIVPKFNYIWKLHLFM